MTFAPFSTLSTLAKSKLVEIDAALLLTVAALNPVCALCSADDDADGLDQLEFNEFLVRLAVLHCPE